MTGKEWLLIINLVLAFISGAISWYFNFTGFQITVIVLLVFNLLVIPDSARLGVYLEDKFYNLNEKLDGLQANLDEIKIHHDD